MLELDDPIWQTLQHAYGNAADIPKLLKQAAAQPVKQSDNYKEEPWYSLWSALCHQGDAYTASYAAVPHLLSIAETVTSLPAWDLLGLPVSIEIARLQGNAPALPDSLKTDYVAALQKMPSLIARLASHQWSEGFSRVMTAALAIAQGHHRLAETILDLSPDNIDIYWQSQFGEDEE